MLNAQPNDLTHSAALLEKLCDAATVDRDGLGELFELARPRLLRLVKLRMQAMLTRRVDAEDIVQDVLIKATSRFDAFAAGRPVPVLIWLRGLAIDCLIDTTRKHLHTEKRAISREEMPRQNWLSDTSLAITRVWAVDPRSPSEILSIQQRAEDLKTALGLLPENYREVLVLRFFESLTIAETASTMNCSVANAKVLQFRAVKRLEKILESDLSWNSADRRGGTP